jgi:hypothetical protein
MREDDDMKAWPMLVSMARLGKMLSVVLSGVTMMMQMSKSLYRNYEVIYKEIKVKNNYVIVRLL